MGRKICPFCLFRSFAIYAIATMNQFHPINRTSTAFVFFLVFLASIIVFYKMFNYSRLCCFPTFLDIEACLSFLHARRKVSVYHGLNWIKLDVVTSERILYVNVHLLCEIYYARLVRGWLGERWIGRSIGGKN